MRIAKMLRYAVLFMTDLMVMTGGNNRAMAEKRLVKEIPFSALEGVRVGNAQDNTAKTGVTELYRISQPSDLFTRTNTTIGAIITNGSFDKAELTRIAGLTRNAYARAIRPVGTMADGDTVYAVSCGKPVKADINMAGTLAAEVMAKAIENAVTASRMEDQEYLSHCPGIAKKDD